MKKTILAPGLVAALLLAGIAGATYIPSFVVSLLFPLILLSCFGFWIFFIIHVMKLGVPPKAGKTDTYRKCNGKGVWHFSDSCPDWPRENFQEISGPPEIPSSICDNCYTYRRHIFESDPGVMS